MPVGKKWYMDELKLRVPSAEYGYVAVAFYVDSTSSKKVLIGLRDETAASIEKANNQHQAKVRPKHGDVLVLRLDSHPSHRSIRGRCALRRVTLCVLAV